jgi:hypothetical protein
MAGYAVRTTCAQYVSCGQTLSSAGGFERHTQPSRAVFHRFYLCAIFDLDSEALQMFAQDCLGAPLRQAALKFILAPNTGEFRSSDFLQARAQQLNLSYAYTRVEKRLDQASPIDDFQYCRLQCGPAGLVMRR